MKKTAPQLLNELIESLGQASGAASQIIHQHQDPRWITVREALDLAKEGCMGLAVMSATKTIAIKKG